MSVALELSKKVRNQPFIFKDEKGNKRVRYVIPDIPKNWKELGFEEYQHNTDRSSGGELIHPDGSKMTWVADQYGVWRALIIPEILTEEEEEKVQRKIKSMYLKRDIAKRRKQIKKMGEKLNELKEDLQQMEKELSLC